MHITRRRAVQLLGGAGSALALRNSFASNAVQVAPGAYQPTRASLKAYTIPDWFADAKFGIWSHWGPQSAIGDGDWYARALYQQGSPQYQYHLKRFGHPSKIGYKDLIPLYTADKWDPDALMDLYVKAGAKYFFSMGVHHDNYDLWNSKYQPRWNAVSSGPRKDVVGLWAAAARRRGLRFGVSEHLSNSYSWFAPSHLSDGTGPYKGVPYDGANPAFADLYHDYEAEPANFAATTEAMSRNAPAAWKQHYFNRIQDLITQHQPDLLYTDGGIPFEEYGLGTVAELYNVGPVDQRGQAEAVFFSKTPADCAVGTCVLDRERAVADSIWPVPWQTDTCIGEWHYKEGGSYKSAKKVIDLLVDIVSKNGNLLLNFPLPASGELDPAEMRTLNGITQWMSVNQEGLFASRPWKVAGEGPSTQKAGAPRAQDINAAEAKFAPNEGKQPDLGAQDVRYTVKGKSLYAFVQGWPGAQAELRSLGTSSAQNPDKVAAVRMLGHGKLLTFTQAPEGLRVTLPGDKPATADTGITLKVTFAG